MIEVLKNVDPNLTFNYTTFEQLIDDPSNITIDDLKELSQTELCNSNNIGFLLITNQNDDLSDKSKHYMELIYNKIIQSTKFILLFHLYNKNTDSYNLTNIMINNKHNYITFENFIKYPNIIKLIKKDYPDIKLS